MLCTVEPDTVETINLNADKIQEYRRTIMAYKQQEYIPIGCMP